VPKNMKLLAIPLFELYDNAARCAPPFYAVCARPSADARTCRYGPQLSAIPHLLSRCAPPSLYFSSTAR
jgi:cleavage and polyadenylation specificity factor subunit 5